MNNETFEKITYTGKGKNKIASSQLFRRLTLEEYKALSSGNRVHFVTRQGDIKQVKVTSVKTWKTRPDVLVKVKFGLYEYSYSQFDGSNYSGEILVREVESNAH